MYELILSNKDIFICVYFDMYMYLKKKILELWMINVCILKNYKLIVLIV